jgi:hypothetical protein
LSRAAEDNAHVVLPGEACAVGVDALLQLLTRLRMWSSRFTVARLDLAVDCVPFTPAHCGTMGGATRLRDGRNLR